MLQDLRYTLRIWRRSPAFAISALVTLALAIGANTAIFSIVDAAVLRPLPYDESDRLVTLAFRNVVSGRRSTGANPRDFLDWRERQQVFEHLVLTGGRSALLLGDGEPEEVSPYRVTSGYFEMLRVQPGLGRSFAASDELAGHDAVAIISHDFWRERYGGAPDVLGKHLRLDDDLYEIVGVLPESYRSPTGRPARIFIPLALTAKERQHGIAQSMGYGALGRLREGVTIDQAAARMSDLQKVLDQQHAAFNKGYEIVELTPWLESYVGQSRSWMLMLLGAVGLVLLISCANVANLVLAHGSTRVRELTVRGALGATRWRIARQLLAESILLAAVGGLAGLLLAWWGLSALRAATPGTVPRAALIAVDWRVFLFTSSAALGTGILCGLLPALQGSRVNLVSGLKDGVETGGRHRQRVRLTLAWAEVALAVMLLVGAALFITSFSRLLRVDPGFEAGGIMSVRVAPPRTMDLGPRRTAYLMDIVDSVGRVPGVEQVALASGTPFASGFSTFPLRIVGRPAANAGAEDDQAIRFQSIGPGLLELLRVPLMRGRMLTDGDDQSAPPVAVINDVAARRYWPGEDPIGQQITIQKQTYTIVGIVGAIRYASITTPPQPEVFLPMRQSNGFAGTLLIRTRGTPAGILPSVKAAIWAVAPNQPVTEVTTVNASLAQSTARRRFNTLVMTLFGVVALAIAASGIFGVLTFMVGQRRREIGVRLALGARGDQVILLFLRQGAWVLGTGIIAGLAGAWALSRTVEGFLFEVQARDPRVFAVVALTLGAIGMLACWLPARRASQVDPMSTLRSE